MGGGGRGGPDRGAVRCCSHPRAGCTRGSASRHAWPEHALPPPVSPQDSEPVTALAMSPDGQTLFSASRALLVRAWSTTTGRPVQSFPGHKAPVAAMAVDPTGTLLATASADHHTRVFDIAGGFCTHSFGGHRCGAGDGRLGCPGKKGAGRGCVFEGMGSAGLTGARRALPGRANGGGKKGVLWARPPGNCR